MVRLLMVVFFGIFSSVLHAQFIPFAAWEQLPKVLKFLTPAQGLSEGICSGANTVQSTYGKTVPLNVTSDLTVNLPVIAGVTYFSDIYCTQPITNATILSGTNQVTFYYLNTNTADIDLLVTATDYWEDEQTHTFSTNAYIWTGAGAPSSDWGTGANWSGGVPPGSGNRAVFDGTCVSNCNPSFSSNVDIGGIRMDAGYTGTIAPGTFQFQVRNLDFVINSGTFTGDPTGVAETRVHSLGGRAGLVIAGGTFNFPAGTLRFSGDLITYPEATINNPTNSILRFDCVSSGYSCRYQTMDWSLNGNEVYEFVEIVTRRTNIRLGNTTMTIAKDFYDYDHEANGQRFDNGTFAIGGDYTTGSRNHRGNAWYEFTGNPAGQNITTGTYTPGIRIDAGANTVTLNGTVQTDDYDYVSGTLVTTGSTLYINCWSSGDSCRYGSHTINLGSHTYNNLTLRFRRGGHNLGGATWNIGGTLTFGGAEDIDTLRNGTINAYGDVVENLNGVYGSALVKIMGNASGQTVTGTGNFPFIEIDAGVNTVTLAGIIRTPHFVYTSSGTFNTTGSRVAWSCFSSDADIGCRYGSMTGVFGGQTYDDFEIRGRRCNPNLGGQTVTVNGDFYFGDYETGADNLDNGTINVSGNVTELGFGHEGNANIRVVGNAAGQTLTGITNGEWPFVEIVAGANPVTISGHVETNKWTYTSSGTFTTTGSTIQIECDGLANCDSGGTVDASTWGTVAYNNVILRTENANMDLGGQTITVNGNLNIGSGDDRKELNNGTINVLGDLTMVGSGYAGSADIYLNGNAAGQTITGAAITADNDYFPHIHINAGANPITITGYIGIEEWTYVSSGTFTSTGSKIDFNAIDGRTRDNMLINDLVFGSVTYDSIELYGENNDMDFGGATITMTGDLTLGDDTANKNMNNVSFSFAGNLAMAGNGYSGNASLTFTGANAQTINGLNLQMPDGTVTVNKTAGTTLTFLSEVDLTGTGQDFTMVSGDVDLNGQTLNINDVLTIGTGTTFTQNAGTLNYGSLVNNGTLNP